MSEERLARIETALGGLRTDVDGLKTDVQGLRTDVDGLKSEVKDLGRQMRVLHEDTIANIKALAPDDDQINRGFRAADAELEQRLDRRIVPLETFVREQSRGRPDADG